MIRCRWFGRGLAAIGLTAVLIAGGFLGCNTPSTPSARPPSSAPDAKPDTNKPPATSHVPG
jgi:hypothetical protein